MAQNGFDLPALSVRRPYLATVLNLLIIIAGISAIFGVEVRELPDVDRPIVTVRANYPGGSPETLDSEVTSELEAAVARVNGVKSVRSSSEENNMRIRVEFSPDVDLNDAANDIREAVSRVQRELPEDVEDIFVIKADSDAQSIIQLSIFSDKLAIDELTRKIEDEIIPELTAVSGVADVQIFGQRERVLRVSIDPIKLASHRLAIADIANVLKSARFDIPAGSFESEKQEVIVRANASVIEPEKIKKLVLRDPVTLGDVADVFYSPEDPESYVRLNGRTVINLGIVRQAQSNTISISQGVKRVVERLNTRHRDINIVTLSDESRFIEGAIREVLGSLTLAVIIVMSVIALFLGNLRTALIPAAGIPVALIGTVAAIWLLGFSINLVTLLALVLAAGLVVDDTIVVLENIQRLRLSGMEPRAAAVIGTRQVFFAVVATTATLISVFLPISFLPSTAGRLFTEFGFVLAVAVCISSFVALTITPMLSARLPAADPEKTAGRTSLWQALGRGLTRLYAMILSGVLRVPLVAVGLCLLIGSGAAIVFQNLGEELVPKEDRGRLIVRLVGPDGTGLEYADKQVGHIEDMFRPLLEKGIVTDLFTITGRYDPNRGWIEAPLRDWSERDVTEGDVEKMLKEPISELPGAQARIIRGNSLGLRNAGGGIKFALTGSDYGHIAEAATDFVEAIEQNIPELKNLRVEFRATQPQLAVNIDRRRATDLGVPIQDLATTVQALVDNDKVAELTVHDKAIPVLLQAVPGAIDDPADLANIFVRGSEGRMVPLAHLVTFEEFAVAAELDRHGQRRAIEIDADLERDFTLRNAVDAISELGARKLPNDIGIMFLNEARELNETSHGMTVTFLVALLIVFLVLVAQFEGLTSGLVVLLTVPFGICAAIFALALTGTTINIYSQIGVLMLIGIMAKNSILMVEFADQLREQGKGVWDAAREASLVRLRPIMMTMVSTVLAGLPLILSDGPGAEARTSIGWVVFGGLGLSAIFTLFLTPALYVLLAPMSKSRSHAAERLETELANAEKISSKPVAAE